MIKAVLLDLDNTLLNNPPMAFVDAYLQALIRHLHQAYRHITPRQWHEAMQQAIHALLTNRDPATTNWQVFVDDFITQTNLDPNDLQHQLAAFYQQRYPALQRMTSSIPAAAKLVDWLLEHQYAVAIATNPMFPKEAIEQRLRWAGLDLSRLWFVSTMENTHFTKPQPHYFEEVLTRIGFETDEALMIGDDMGLDIIPAHDAGLNTYWITTHAPPPGQLQPDGYGTLEDLFLLITHEQWLETLQPQPLSSAQIMPRMLGNVGALMGIVTEVPAHFWHQRPDPNEWSPLEIVLHLYQSERNVQRVRLQRILEEDNPFLVAPHPPPLPGHQNLDGMDGIEQALLFAQERASTLKLLERLSDKEWMRPARHSVFGPTSLLEMAAFTTRHDRLHINQLCQTVGKCE